MRTTGGGVGRQVARWTGRRVPRADPTVWQVAYLVVIVLAVVGSVAWQWFAKVAAPALGAHAGGPGLGCAFLLAGVLVVQGGLTLVLRAVGPIAFGRAVLTWCLASSTLGARLHRRALKSRGLAAAAVTAAAGVAATLTVSPGAGGAVHAVEALGGILVAVLVGPALVLITAAEQAEAPRAHLAVTQGAGTGLVLVGLLIWYLAAFGVITVGPVAALGLGGALAGLTIARGLARLRRVLQVAGTGAIPLGELQRAGDVVDRVTASVTMLAGLALQAAPRRRRPLRFGGPIVPNGARPAWLAWVDVRRALARRTTLTAVVLLVPLTGSVTRVAGHGWGCSTLIALDLAVATRLAGWLTAWSVSPGLRFLVPFPDPVARASLLAAPVAGAVAFAAAAVGPAGLSPLWIPTSAMCALLGVARRMRARDYGADFALMAWTPVGPLPINLGLRLAAGWDAVALGALASLLPAGAALRNVSVAVLIYVTWTSVTGRRRTGHT